MKTAQAKKRIVFVESWLNTIYVRFINELSRTNPQYDIYFITDRDSLGNADKDLFRPEIHVIGLRNRTWVRKLVFFPLYAGSFFSAKYKQRYAESLYLHTFVDLQKTLDNIRPDVLQANVLLMPYTMQTGRYARKNNIPFILRTEEQRTNGLVQKFAMRAVVWLNRKTLRHATYILPWTTQGVSYVTETFKVPSKKVVLLPAGVDTTFLTPKKQYAHAGPLRLIAIQRFLPYKEYSTLLTGLRLALDAGKKIHLTIVGSGPLASAIHAQVQTLSLAKHVTFAKPVPYRFIPALLRSHDALVLTSHYEAIGMVVPEAMACGLAVVVSDTAGAALYVHKNTGVLFTARNHVSLASALEKLSLADTQRMGKNAARTIRKQYAIPVVVAAFAALLDTCVKK